MKELGIYEIQHLWEKEESLWVYLTTEWLQLKKPSNDNVSRWKLKNKWRIIAQAAMLQNISLLVRKKVKQGDMKRLLDQGAGILISIGALADHNSIQQSLNMLENWENRTLQNKGRSFPIETQLRRDKFLEEM